jgi:flagellin-specific chaperone FliS
MNDTNNPTTPAVPLEAENGQNTDEVSAARETLKAALQVGLTVQMVSVVATFAIKKGKEDFLKKLNDLILELHNSLSDEEKKELQDDTNAMMEQKAEELVTSLGEELSPEELDTVVKEIKDLAQTEK